MGGLNEVIKIFAHNFGVFLDLEKSTETSQKSLSPLEQNLGAFLRLREAFRPHINLEFIVFLQPLSSPWIKTGVTQGPTFSEARWRSYKINDFPMKTKARWPNTMPRDRLCPRTSLEAALGPPPTEMYLRGVSVLSGARRPGGLENVCQQGYQTEKSMTISWYFTLVQAFNTLIIRGDVYKKAEAYSQPFCCFLFSFSKLL